jgi:hypothetical protein
MGGLILRTSGIPDNGGKLRNYCLSKNASRRLKVGDLYALSLHIGSNEFRVTHRSLLQHQDSRLAKISMDILLRLRHGLAGRSRLARPRHRVVAVTPPEWLAASVSLQRSMLPSPLRGRAWPLDLRSRGHLCVHFRYGPMTCSPSLGWLCRSAAGIQFPSSLLFKLRSFQLLPRWDCLSRNMPAFAGHTGSPKLRSTAEIVDFASL